jgi:predicted outer membrane protein
MNSTLLVLLLIDLISFGVSFDKFHALQNVKYHQKTLNFQKTNDDSLCDSHLAAFSDGLRKREMWALTSD